MAKRKSQRDPFEVTLSAEKTDELVKFLTREIDYAMTARMAVVGDDGLLDDAHLKYLGGDEAITKDTPWPGAANLGSYLVTEKVDAMRARVMATIFTDPIWIVEGFGEAAERAPIVEEFHQWKADQTKLQPVIGRAVHNALLEGTGVLEVADRVVMRKGLRRIKAALQVDPQTGAVILGDNGHPQPQLGPDQRMVEARGDQPSADMIVSDIVRATAGPSYRVLSLKDFYLLPGHAAETADLWGYAKRFWRRLSELQERERDGYYTHVDELGTQDERYTPSGGGSDVRDQERAGQAMTPQTEPTAVQKEIWELTLLLDLDDDGFEEWYIVTWSQIRRQILRVQYQDYDTPSYVLLVPFPRPNSVYGFSYAKDKLGSLYDEHAAYRNMFADRMTLKTSAPILQVYGSLWNPAERPFGPTQTIPVRDLNELKQFEVADVPQSLPLAMHEVMSAAERISGMNDTTTGQMSQADRTLGEVKLVTQQSWIRIDEIVKNLQQAFEDLFTLLNIIWKQKLRDAPEPWPGDLIVSMQQRGIDIGPTITADMLDGAFRGKPRGSVEASDFSQMRADMVQMITAITQLSQGVPVLKAQLNNPATIRSIMTQIARVYRWPDRTNLIGSFTGESPAPPPEPPPAPKVTFSLKGEDLADPQIRQVFDAAEHVNPPTAVTPPVGVPGVPNRTA